MNRLVVAVLTLVILSSSFAGAGYAAYNGAGLAHTSTSTQSARTGSLWGIHFLGGGPGSGK